MIRAVHRRIAARGDDHVWIHLVPEADAIAAARRVAATRAASAPLFGLPCAIKGNIDVPGLPSTSAFPRSRRACDLAFVWSGPDQWLACTHQAPALGMEALLAQPFGAHAAVVDQSHARTLLRITGSHVRVALCKGLAIDLHPREFRTGHAAVTAVAHVGVRFWQIDDRPCYEFAVPRAYALSFWRWLEASAAEYGLQFVGPAMTS